MWLGIVRHALLHLIPNPKGGRRPIGLVDGVCRLWEFARRPILRAWRSECRKGYDYGAKGRTSTNAVRGQSLCNEAAVAGDSAAATILVDLAKVFESVPPEHAWRRGLAIGVAPRILRLALEVSCFAGHLTPHGVTADGVLALPAILASTSFATDELFVVMAAVCDDLLRVWPPLAETGLGLTLVVDDLGLHMRAPTARSWASVGPPLRMPCRSLSTSVVW